MRTQRLAFSQLHEELEVLETGSLKEIKGGNVPAEAIWGTDAQGNLYWRAPEGHWRIYEISLNEVIITGSAPAGLDWSTLYTLFNSNNNWSITGTYNNGNGPGGGSSGSSGSNALANINPTFSSETYLSTVINTYTISANDAYSLFGTMNTLQNVNYSLTGLAPLSGYIVGLVTICSLIDSDWGDLQANLYNSGYTGNVSITSWTTSDADGYRHTVYGVTRADGTPIGTASIE